MAALILYTNPSLLLLQCYFVNNIIVEVDHNDALDEKTCKNKTN